MPRLTLESLFVLRFSGRHLAMKSGQGTERLIGRQRGKSARKACQAGSLLIDTLSWKDSSTRYSTSLEYSTDYKRYQKPMLVLWMDLEEVKVEMKFRSTRMIAPNRGLPARDDQSSSTFLLRTHKIGIGLIKELDRNFGGITK